MNHPSGARDKLAIALDLPLAPACSLYQTVSFYVAYAKIGLSLFVEHGPVAVERFLDLGARIFLDLKLHDIPNTVELASERAAAMGIDFLTVHASGGASMLRAAREGAKRGADRAGCPAPRLLAVTILTSLSNEDLSSIGMGSDVPKRVVQLGRVAVDAGIDGLVCSAREARQIRGELGTKPFLCTPGIRLHGSTADDQARAESPREAIEAGANLLVVGRPIHAASDPVAAAKEFNLQVQEVATQPPSS